MTRLIQTHESAWGKSLRHNGTHWCTMNLPLSPHRHDQCERVRSKQASSSPQRLPDIRIHTSIACAPLAYRPPSEDSLHQRYRENVQRLPFHTANRFASTRRECSLPPVPRPSDPQSMIHRKRNSRRQRAPKRQTCRPKGAQPPMSRNTA